MAALAKDPAQRWQTADDFSNALVAAREQLGAGNGEVQHTAVFAPVPVAEAEQAATELLPEEERKRRWPWFTLGLLTLLLAGVLAFLAFSGLLSEEKVEVPRVVGKQLLEARAALEKRGFEVTESRVQSAQPLDQVIDQDPNPAVEAEKGSTVTLEVSTGPGHRARAGGRGTVREAGGALAQPRRAGGADRRPELGRRRCRAGDPHACRARARTYRRARACDCSSATDPSR